MEKTTAELLKESEIEMRKVNSEQPMTSADFNAFFPLAVITIGFVIAILLLVK